MPRNGNPRHFRRVKSFSPLQIAFQRWKERAPQRRREATPPSTPRKPPPAPLLRHGTEPATERNADALLRHEPGTALHVPCNESGPEELAGSQQLAPVLDPHGRPSFRAEAKSACSCSTCFKSFDAVYHPEINHSIMSMSLVARLGLRKAKLSPRQMFVAGPFEPEYWTEVTFRSGVGVPETTVYMCIVDDIVAKASSIDCYLGRRFIELVKEQHHDFDFNSVFSTGHHNRGGTLHHSSDLTAPSIPPVPIFSDNGSQLDSTVASTIESFDVTHDQGDGHSPSDFKS